jgi:hypothetical protein
VGGGAEVGSGNRSGVGLWMRCTVVKRHRRRSASQKMLQQRSERLRGSGAAPASWHEGLGLEQQLRGSGAAPAAWLDVFGLKQQLRSSGAAPAAWREGLGLEQQLRGSGAAPAAWREGLGLEQQQQAVLHRARRRQALPAGGLLQVSR